MTYSPILIVHICCGIIAVLSGSAALLVRKGGSLHRTAGQVFVISMLLMSSSGAYIAFVKSQPGNVLGGVVTFYLVATAWLTVIRGREIGAVDYGLLLVALAVVVTGSVFGLEAAGSATGVKDGKPAAAYFGFAFLALLSGGGDVRLFIHGRLAGAQRIARHLWRMCFALFIAVVSFFLGTADDPVVRRTGLRTRLFSQALRRTHLPEVPVLIVALLTIYWLCRVLMTSEYKRPRGASARDRDRSGSHSFAAVTRAGRNEYEHS